MNWVILICLVVIALGTIFIGFILVGILNLIFKIFLLMDVNDELLEEIND